jgi:hypothetical protein
VGLRLYDPQAGSWLSYDPVWNNRDPNYLTFCGGDPINSFDPDGRCANNDSLLNFDFPTYEAMVQAHWNSQYSWNSSFVGPSDGSSGSSAYSLPYPDPLRQLLSQYPGLYQSPIEAFYGAREWDQALAAAPTVLADLALTAPGEMVLGPARDLANVLTYGVESAQGYSWNSEARRVSWSAATWSVFGLALTFTPVGLEERTMLTLEKNVARSGEILGPTGPGQFVLRSGQGSLETAGVVRRGEFVNRLFDSGYAPGAGVSGPLGRSFAPGSGVPTTAAEGISQRGLNIFYPNNAQQAAIYQATEHIPATFRTSIGGTTPEVLIDPGDFGSLRPVIQYPVVP